MKNNFFLGLAAALSACLLGVACSVDPVESVNNHSFGFSCEVHQDNSTGKNILVLSLDKGPQQQEDYLISYSIDGSITEGLFTLENNLPVGTSFSRSYKQDDTEDFFLTDLPIGEHTITFEFKSKWYSSSLSKTFVVSTIPFKVHCEVDTLSSEESYLLINLTEGASSNDIFSIYWDIDSTKVNELHQIDFSDTPIVKIPLGVLTPTEHQASVRITDGIHSVSTSISFKEPTRYSTIEMRIKLDNKGDVSLSIEGNHYGSNISISSTYTITGTCNYWTSGQIVYNEEPSELLYRKSKTISESNSFDADIFSDCTLSLCPRTQMINTLEGSWESSAVWKRYWDFSGEGGYYYKVDGNTPVHYSVSKEEIDIQCQFNLEDSVKVTVVSEIDFCCFNTLSLTKSKEYIF